MSDPTDVRAELHTAEEHLAELRARNAQLERMLLKPTALRNRAIATLALAALGGALAYVGATRAGDARAGAARAHLEAEYEDVCAAQRRGIDGCKETLQNEENATLACKAKLEELRRSQPPLPRNPVRVDRKCACQVGDPLCSCL